MKEKEEKENELVREPKKIEGKKKERKGNNNNNNNKKSPER